MPENVISWAVIQEQHFYGLEENFSRSNSDARRRLPRYCQAQRHDGCGLAAMFERTPKKVNASKTKVNFSSIKKLKWKGMFQRKLGIQGTLFMSYCEFHKTE